jgi:hypothetical protein
MCDTTIEDRSSFVERHNPILTVDSGLRTTSASSCEPVADAVVLCNNESLTTFEARAEDPNAIALTG